VVYERKFYKFCAITQNEVVRDMAWGGFGWGRGRGWNWMNPWPGRGPFSHLPPWQRPGWIFGRGACRWLFPWMFWPWYGWWFRSFLTPWMYMPYYWYMPYMPWW